MTEKDLRPTRYLLTFRYARSFVTEFFEQNPISQLGILGMRDGLAVRISDMSGNPIQHISALNKFGKEDPGGNPSLQNALEVARAALFHAPSHGTREVFIIYGALLSSDPGDIHDTIKALVQDNIRVSMVGLAAQVKICDDLCKITNNGDDGYYHVAIDEQHFRELVMAVTTPPVTRSKKQSQSSLLMMGFPSRTIGRVGAGAAKGLTLCACHSKLSRGGYLCSRCDTKVCSLPAECPACGLTLILSTHLARSYHHLFPLKNWVEVSWAEAKNAGSHSCYACQSPFPTPPKLTESTPRQKTGEKRTAKFVSESGRYACTVCRNHFCIDCDEFSHEVVHNCPGCQGDTRTGEDNSHNGSHLAGADGVHNGLTGLDGTLYGMEE
jgi:transcription initiation factor TFIIH subunit 2